LNTRFPHTLSTEAVDLTTWEFAKKASRYFGAIHVA
jgi:hypothetical protein